MGRLWVWRTVLIAGAHFQIAGTSAASPYFGKLRADLLCLDDATALRAMDVFSENSLPLLIPARSENHQVARDIFRSPGVAISGMPKCVKMEKEGCGDMRFLRIFARRFALSSSFGARARTLGSMEERAASRAECTTAWRRMPGSSRLLPGRPDSFD